jgi:hypothetical protein
MAIIVPREAEGMRIGDLWAHIFVHHVDVINYAERTIKIQEVESIMRETE